MSSYKFGVVINIDELKESFVSGLRMAEQFAKQSKKILDGVQLKADTKVFDEELKQINSKIKKFQKEGIRGKIEIEDFGSKTLDKFNKNLKRSAEKQKSFYW